MKKIFYFLLGLIFLVSIFIIPFVEMSPPQLKIEGEQPIDIKDMDVTYSDEKDEITLYNFDKETSLTIMSYYRPLFKSYQNSVLDIRYVDYNVKAYEIDEGFEYEIIFNEEPKSNIIEIPIDLNGLVYYYQPPLTEELDSKNYDSLTETTAIFNKTIVEYRPENIVGSYAFYSIKKGNKYKTGKAFHLYRPLIYDNVNNSVWGELNIQDNLITITIPNGFLKSAKYPITVDPTFGKTDFGSSYYQMGTHLYGTVFTAPENGTLTGISVGISIYSGGDRNLISALYESDDPYTPNLYQPDEQLATSPDNAILVWENRSLHWVNFTYNDIELVNNTDYWLWTRTWGNYWRAWYDSGTTEQSCRELYFAFTDPHQECDEWWDREFSVYATYEIPPPIANFSVTFVKDYGSTFLINGTDTGNNTVGFYLNQTVLNLEGVMGALYEFENFDVDFGNYTILVNPYNWTIEENQTIRLNIIPTTTARIFPLNEMVLITDIFIIILSLIGFFVPFASWITLLLSLVVLVPMPNLTGSNSGFLITFTVGTITLSIILFLFGVLRRMRE